MEVHPPEHGIHSWRDFFVHMATITLGLLIALGLEGLVEYTHHRHLVREARENIRREMENNNRQAKGNRDLLEENAARMMRNVEVARALRLNPHAFPHGSMNFNFTWSSFDASAWQSARDSGALTYMPTAEVQGFADVYNQQEIINHEAISIFTQQSLAAAPLIAENGPDGLRPDEAGALVVDSARIYILLHTLEQLIENLQQQYGHELK